MFEELYEQTLKDLPVASIKDYVVNAVVDNTISIVAAPTGSGKTLVLTSQLADYADEQVVVCVPRRFLAINAAETVAKLSNVPLGEGVGYAIGSQGGEESKFNKNTKLLFVTYGYALSSGLINTANYIVLDEVHEADTDMSIAKALLYERLQMPNNLKILEMSATIDAQKQEDYWRDTARTEIFTAEGQAYPCDVRYEKKKPISTIVADLIKKEKRQGILVFTSGKSEIVDVGEKIKQKLADRRINNVEIATIHGEMSSEERIKALAPQKHGNIKILIGTNVIESGMNLPWVDTGVSDGFGKAPVADSRDAVMLELIDLPRWRLQQQEGRVKRFTDGIFVLASQTAFAARPERMVPEIERLPLTKLVMESAIHNLNPLDLKWDGNIDPKKIELAQQRLERLGILQDNNLTEKGKVIANMPLSPENGAMLFEAQNHGAEALSQAITLAAIMENGIRRDFRIPHGQDNSSDHFDGLIAFWKTNDTLEKLAVIKRIFRAGYKELPQSKALDKILLSQAKPLINSDKLISVIAKKFGVDALYNNRIFKERYGEPETLDDRIRVENADDFILAEMNVSRKRFEDSKNIAIDLAKRLNCTPQLSEVPLEQDALTKSILAGNLNNLYNAPLGSRFKDNVLLGYSYDCGNNSAVGHPCTNYFVANPVTIAPKNGKKPFTILEKITEIPSETLMDFIGENPELFSHRDNQVYLLGQGRMPNLPVEDLISTLTFKKRKNEMTNPNEIYFYENLDELIGQASANRDCEATTAISSLINLARNENNPKANRLLEEAHLKHQVTYGEEFNLEDLARPVEVNKKISAPNLEYLARTKILAR